MMSEHLIENENFLRAADVCLRKGNATTSIGIGKVVRPYFSPNRDKPISHKSRHRLLSCLRSRFRLSPKSRRMLIEELKKSRNDLETKVRERTTQLEQNNRALQEFISNASHDMQEPLRKILTFGNMLRTKCKDTLSDLESEYLGKMEKSALRMQSLLKSLLEYSRVTTIKANFVQVDLNKLISEVLEDLEGRINETGAKVKIGQLPTIKADPNQMWQLFQNLISNSLKYGGDGIPLIKIYSKRFQKGLLHIFIKDNGIGFDEKNLEAIFAPFRRLHGKSSQYEGTGLGLAICQKIVELHRGEITAKSKPGEGATFILTFPMNHGIQLSLFPE